MLKVLQTKFENRTQPGSPIRVFGNESFALLEKLQSEALMHHYFSARYLCFKYIVRMLSNYLIN